MLKLFLLPAFGICFGVAEILLSNRIIENERSRSTKTILLFTGVFLIITSLLFIYVIYINTYEQPA